MKLLILFQINRKLFRFSLESKPALVGFSDASPAAHNAVIYLRSETCDGSAKSYLICSKTKVAPIKLTTIPKLEFQGALLLAELIH